MPASCGEIRPSGTTAVASLITRPAPPRAKEPRCTRCQSDGRPSTEEYWHMGEPHTRLRTRVPREDRGSKRLLTYGFNPVRSRLVPEPLVRPCLPAPPAARRA